MTLTERQRAGQKADATKVVDLVRDRFSNPAKDAIRAWVIQELKAVEPTLVLDLWGGGRSADEMTDAGLRVLSVEDGRAFAPYGVSKPRVRRALELRAEAGGYQAGWGSAKTYAPRCDAAWLDFMGHLCAETVRTLEACRGMKAIAITLMPDRMAGVANLPVGTWTVMYRAAIEHHTGLRVRHIPRRYRRENGGWVLVILARGSLPKRRVHGHITAPESPRKREYKAALMADPEHQAKSRAYSAAWRLRNPDHQKVATAAFQARFATDPEFREQVRAKRRAWRDRPETRAKRAEYEARRRADPERVARRNELKRARYAARKTAA